MIIITNNECIKLIGDEALHIQTYSDNTQFKILKTKGCMQTISSFKLEEIIEKKKAKLEKFINKGRYRGLFADELIDNYIHNQKSIIEELEKIENKGDYKNAKRHKITN